MSASDTAELDIPIKDVTNQQNHTTMNAEAAAVAREKGWVPPEKYDYSKYTTVAPGGPVEGEANNEAPEWASNAAKYEWNEEYGDIGPPNPELEEMLFHNEYINRVGIKFEL
jgi:ATP-dependent RNA helicase DDX3X